MHQGNQKDMDMDVAVINLKEASCKEAIVIHKITTENAANSASSISSADF